MKKITLFLALLMGFSGFLHAQQTDSKATELLKTVGAKYKGYQSVRAVFQVNMEDNKGKVTDTHNGTLYLKGNSFKIELQNQEIMCDGKTIWTYLKDANNVQINDYAPDNNTINPSEIFTLYQKNFLYALTEEKNVGGKVVDVVDLTPNDKTRNYFKVRLTIDKADKSITKATIFNKDGSKMNYEMQKLTPNFPVTDSFFTFDTKAHPGVQADDLREGK